MINQFFKVFALRTVTRKNELDIGMFANNPGEGVEKNVVSLVQPKTRDAQECPTVIEPIPFSEFAYQIVGCWVKDSLPHRRVDQETPWLIQLAFMNQLEYRPVAVNHCLGTADEPNESISIGAQELGPYRMK